MPHFGKPLYGTALAIHLFDLSFKKESSIEIKLSKRLSVHFCDLLVDTSGDSSLILFDGAFASDELLDLFLQDGANAGYTVVVEVVSAVHGSSEASLDEVFREEGIL